MPNGVAMAFKLAAYGAISGFLYNRSKWQCVVALYRSLIIAMLGGRVIWGIVRVVFIPALMTALNKTGIVRFHSEQKVAVKAGQGL